MASVSDREGDVRNFRSWYYDNLGLRGVQQRKALDLLLKDDEIDLEKLSTFCLQFGLPAFRRPMVWKLLLGVLPCHQQIHDFVLNQQTEQVDILLRTLKITRQLSEKNDSVPSQIVQMFLLNEGEMGFTEPSEVKDTKFIRLASFKELQLSSYSIMKTALTKKLERKLKILTAIAKLMCEIFETIVDCFFATTKFFKLQETCTPQLKTLTELFEQKLTAEDPELHKHLCTIGALKQLPCKRWFESFFAEDLKDPSLERIWDKVIAGSHTILVYVAVAILVVFRQFLISKKTSEHVTQVLSQINASNRCETIVGKAIDLHIKYGVVYNVKEPTNTSSNDAASNTSIATVLK